MDSKPEEELETYGDSGISSKNAPVPKSLLLSYIFWFFFGLVWFYFFWNGSYGWLDRGYWQQLQRAARTTMPFHKGPIENTVEHKEAVKHQ